MIGWRRDFGGNKGASGAVCAAWVVECKMAYCNTTRGGGGFLKVEHAK